MKNQVLGSLKRVNIVNIRSELKEKIGFLDL